MNPIREIVDEEKIFNILERTKNPSKEKIIDILDKAKEKKGLLLQEVSCLLHCTDLELLNLIFETSAKIKTEIYGNRLVLFAPLYLSNYCINDCAYCGFHRSNTILSREKLSLNEIAEQVTALEAMGHKRLLLETGEDPVNNTIKYIQDAISAIYRIKNGKGEIRRVNVNIAATSLENYKILKSSKIGTYQLFQETYHYPTYKKLHSGPKADYERQITAMDRAFQAGIDDLGLGVLFGLYDYKFEVLAIVSHAQYLDKKYDVGPHTISVPRWRRAETGTYLPKYPVNDSDFLKITAVLRLAVPYTGIIISTRETPSLRRIAFRIGISQASAASSTLVGGYKRNDTDNKGQFALYDHRSLDEVVRNICTLGYLPSFCTACYRSKRTGESFMKLAKTGYIHNLCQPNALLTFKEYLLDYAEQRTKDVGEGLIKKEIEKIDNLSIYKKLVPRIKRIEHGKRDIYF